jgi:hypothetical protein
MDAKSNGAVVLLITDPLHPWTTPPCIDPEEKSCLLRLIAEMLYKNQTLRFDLLEARSRLERIKAILTGFSSHSASSIDPVGLLATLSSILESKDENQRSN